MRVKKIYFFLVASAAYHCQYAQQVKPFVVNSAGNNFVNSNAQLVSSIGEVAITKVNNSNASISQGFLQKKTNTSSLPRVSSTKDFDIFPNPTTDKVYIQGLEKSEVFRLLLMDVYGRIVYTSEGSLNELSFEKYPNGLYQLLIINQKNAIIAQRSISKIN